MRNPTNRKYHHSRIRLEYGQNASTGILILTLYYGFFGLSPEQSGVGNSGYHKLSSFTFLFCANVRAITHRPHDRRPSCDQPRPVGHLLLLDSLGSLFEASRDFYQLQGFEITIILTSRESWERWYGLSLSLGPLPLEATSGTLETLIPVTLPKKSSHASLLVLIGEMGYNAITLFE